MAVALEETARTSAAMVTVSKQSTYMRVADKWGTAQSELAGLRPVFAS